MAILVGPGFEDLEFWVPLMRMQEEGAEMVIVGLDASETYPSKSGGLSATAQAGADEVNAGQFDAVIMPGGWAPDKLCRHEAVKTLVRDAYAQGKIISSICHGGLVLISAGIVKGHQATGSEGIKDDLINTGAAWTYDQPAFRSSNIVWGRIVPDIPHFCRELVTALSQE